MAVANTGQSPVGGHRAGESGLNRLWCWLVDALAVVAGVLIVAMMVTIFLDVVLRNLGFQSSAHFFSFTEYALLLIPCMGAPWLVREKGHIYVEILLMQLRSATRQRMLVLIGLLCIAVCLVRSEEHTSELQSH